MDIIETLDPSAFGDYLKRYNNTICGRHPIGVMLQVNKLNCEIPFAAITFYWIILSSFISVGEILTDSRLSNEL